MLDQGELGTVRWIVSTEQDTWWDVDKLAHLLTTIEAAEPKLIGHLLGQQLQHRARWVNGSAALVGSWMGPFIIMNTFMLSKLGNPTFHTRCRAQLLNCTASFRGSASTGWHKSCGFDPAHPSTAITGSGRKRGALYNNDHLIQFCSSRAAATNKGLASRLQHRFQRPCSTTMIKKRSHYIMAYNNKRHDPVVAFKDGLPPSLLAVHHVNASGMSFLERSARHARDREAAGRRHAATGACASTLTADQAVFGLWPSSGKKSVHPRLVL
jgi:hypothetical protein